MGCARWVVVGMDSGVYKGWKMDALVQGDMALYPDTHLGIPIQMGNPGVVYERR